MPSEVWPDPTAVSACSICTSFPDGLKVVREKEYWLSPMAEARDYLVGFLGLWEEIGWSERGGC